MPSKSLREELQPFIDFAFVEFGMSEAEFLAQEPIRWNGIMEAWLNRERRLDRRVARLCAVLTGESEEVFMPKLASDEPEEQTVDEMFAVLQAASKPNGK